MTTAESPDADAERPSLAWFRLAEQDLVAARVLLAEPAAANRIAEARQVVGLATGVVDACRPLVA